VRCVKVKFLTTPFLTVRGRNPYTMPLKFTLSYGKKVRRVCQILVGYSYYCVIIYRLYVINIFSYSTVIVYSDSFVVLGDSVGMKK